MKINSNNVDKFMKMIDSCQGPVYLTDWRGNKVEFMLNLKSKLSMYLGIKNLLSNHGDWFEIYAPKREDEAKIMEFLAEENQ